MESKPREYRNNNASETIDVSQVQKATRGFYARVEGQMTFVDITDAKEYGITLALEDIPEEKFAHRHTKLTLVHKDGSVSQLGYMMSLTGKGKPFAEDGMKWVCYEHKSQPNVSRQVQAPSLSAMLKYLQGKYHFTSCKWIK